MEFITGGTGLVGRHLVWRLLKDERRVRLLCRPQTDRSSLQTFLESKGVNLTGLNWMEGNIQDSDFMEEALTGCTRVYHAAAVVSFHPKDKELMKRTNRFATATLVNAMLHAGVTELVHVSSVAALGRVEGQPVHEETPFEDGPNVSAYARSKFDAELEVWRGQEEGLNVLTVNPSVILGEGNFHRSSSVLFKLVRRGLKWYPTGSNGFVSAHDVARACVLLSDHGCWGSRYLLNTEDMSYQALFSVIAKAMDVDPPHRPIRSWMMALAWRLGTIWETISGKKSNLTRESISNTHRDHSYASNRLQRHLAEKGLEWCYQPMTETIEETAKACLKALGPIQR